MTSVNHAGDSSNGKNADELVWFFSINMDSVSKRPYSPSIELATHPAKNVNIGKENEMKMMAPTLSVIFKTRYNLGYIVEGIQLPNGIDRKSLQCYWRSSDQHLVIWAPCTKETTANDITGVTLFCNGFWTERNEMNWREMTSYSSTNLGYSSQNHQLKIQIPGNPYSYSNTVTIHNCQIAAKPVAFVSQILDSKAAEKMRSDELKTSLKLEKKMKKEKQFDGGGGSEKEYWFRNPAISFNHYENKKKEEEEDEEDGEDDEKEKVEEEEESNDGEEEENDDEKEEKESAQLKMKKRLLMKRKGKGIMMKKKKKKKKRKVMTDDN